MLRAVPWLIFWALLLAFLPARRALAQDAPPLEADGSPQAAPRPVSPRPATGKPLPFKPSPSGAAVAKAQPAPSAAGPVAAGPAKAKARGPAVKNDGKRYLRSQDENHDGRISREEFLAGTKKRFVKMDLNGDGVISAQEAATAKAKMLERKARSDARRLAQGKPVKAKARSDRSARPYLSTFDANQDSRVSRKEYLVKREKKFAELDLNRDGVISREEAKAAKAKLLKRREERKAGARKPEGGGKVDLPTGKTTGRTTGPEAQAPQNP